MKSPLLPLLLVLLLLLVVDDDEELVVLPLELVVLLEELLVVPLQTASLSVISQVVRFEVQMPLMHAEASQEPLPLQEQHEGSQSAYVTHEAPSSFVPWSRDGDDGQRPFTASICDWVLPVVPPELVPEQPQRDSEIRREKRPRA